MFELWVPVTLAAAFLQNLRSALQKHLKGRLSTSGATFSRFGFGLPIAALYALMLHFVGGFAFPAPGAAFFLWVTLGGLTQIAATAALVYLFGLRNFAVGTAYSKTETVQAAIFGAVFLGDHLSAPAIFAILLSLAGVVTISLARSDGGLCRLNPARIERSTLIGLASGALFGVSAVAYRGASLSLDGPHFLMQAGYTMAWATAIQTAVMLVFLRLKEPGQIGRIVAAWRVAALVGLAGALGSIGWITAMTLQNVAYVRAVGQVELIFTFIASTVFFKERSTAVELVGIVLIAAGILLLLLKG